MIVCVTIDWACAEVCNLTKQASPPSDCSLQSTFSDDTTFLTSSRLVTAPFGFRFGRPTLFIFFCCLFFSLYLGIRPILFVLLRPMFATLHDHEQAWVTPTRYHYSQ